MTNPELISLEVFSQSMHSKVNPSVLLLGAHRWGHLFVVDELHKVGLRPIVLVPETELTSLKTELTNSQIANKFVAVLVPSIIKLCETIKKMEHCTFLVFSLDDYSVLDSTEIARLPNVYAPFADSAAECVHQKHLLREKWNQIAENSQSLQAVPFQLRSYSSFKDSSTFDLVESSDFDLAPESQLIVKPNSLAGSIAVSSTEGSKLENTCRKTLLLLEEEWLEVANANNVEVSPQLLVEAAIPRSSELHPGAEFSVEFLSFNSKHIFWGCTEKWINCKFLEIGHVYPAPESKRLNDLIRIVTDSVSSLLSELGVQYGISHWEFIVTPDDKIALIEGHLRPAGDHINDLVKFARGKSLTLSLFEMVRKGHVASPPPCRKTAAVTWLFPSEPISHFKRIEAPKNVYSKLFFEDLNSLINRTLENPWHGPSKWGNRYISLHLDAPTYQSLFYKLSEYSSAISIICHEPNTNSEKCIAMNLPIQKLKH